MAFIRIKNQGKGSSWVSLYAGWYLVVACDWWIHSEWSARIHQYLISPEVGQSADIGRKVALAHHIYYVYTSTYQFYFTTGGEIPKQLNN